MYVHIYIPMSVAILARDRSNIAGSELMLILLQQLVFGMPWLPPLHIFGVPPPTSLLHLDDSAIARPHIALIVAETLQPGARQDTLRSDLLQDGWLLVKSPIAQQELGKKAVSIVSPKAVSIASPASPVSPKAVGATLPYSANQHVLDIGVAVSLRKAFREFFRADHGGR